MVGPYMVLLGGSDLAGTISAWLVGLFLFPLASLPLLVLLWFFPGHPRLLSHGFLGLCLDLTLLVHLRLSLVLSLTLCLRLSPFFSVLSLSMSVFLALSP